MAGAAIAGFTYAAVKGAMRARRNALTEGQRFRHAFERSPVGMVVLETDGRFLEANPAFCELVGYTEREICQRTVADLTHPEDVAATVRVMQELIQGKPRVLGLEKRYVARNGTTVWARVSASMPRDQEGRPLTYVAAVENITPRKESEDTRAALALELERMNAILDTVFENAPVGLGVWDRDLRFVRVNHALAEMNGIPMAAHVGRTIEEMLPEADPAMVRIFRRVIETGKPLLNHEVTGLTPAEPGRPRHWNNSYFPIFLGGEIAGAGVVCEEITEKKSSEERMRQTAKLESLGVLAGGIAHDFNNLLTGILGNASLLAAEMPEDADGAELVRGVVQAGERAADLTRQLLAYAGKGKFVVQALDVSTVISEITGLLDISMGGNVRLVLKLAPELPQIEADRGQLQQIVMNLVINAAEAIGPDRAGTVAVTTRECLLEGESAGLYAPAALAPGRYVSIEVADDGCGIDPEILARIFDPFFTTKFMGRGLGLSAVLGIIGSHFGGLKVISTPGQGSAFEVLLPRVSRLAQTHEEPAAASLMSKGAVLVVDDEAVVRQMARAILERFGYKVLVAEDGSRAAELFRERASEIDVVLLDMNMPVLSGEDTLRAMLHVAPGMRVVLSSGYSEAEATHRFAAYRLAGFLQKPYTAAQLGQKVKSAMRERTLR